MSLFNRFITARPPTYQQRHWTDQQLIAQGFQYYRPVKRLTMARVLPASEAPKIIKTSWDTITAKAGYIIAYVAGDTLKKSLDDYDPRPIEPMPCQCSVPAAGPASMCGRRQRLLQPA